MPIIDLINQKFGRLLVISKSLKSTTKRTYCLCQCDCGNLTEVRMDHLKSGAIQSCGCYRTEIINKNLIGMKFNKLLVIEKINKKNIKRKTFWNCLCECGNYKVVDGGNLHSGQVASCGCLRNSLGEENIEKLLIENNINYKKEYSFLDLPKRYFDFAILDNDNNLQYLIEFDGTQHYNENSKWYSIESINRDLEKNDYCINNNILLFRIPYRYRDKLNIELLFDDSFLIKNIEKNLKECD